MMRFRTIAFSLSVLFLILPGSAVSPGSAQERVLVAYGGQNETVAPMWVGIEKGLFRKYGLDVKMLQVRSGQVIMAALASGGVRVVWAAPSSVLSAASGGMKISCVASGSDKIPRELVAQKEVQSLEQLRGKVFGVQSIGGGMWLRAMIMLENLGVDPERYQLKIRVVGDDATNLQALISRNIDAAVMSYGFSSQAKRAGLRSLADGADLKTPFQGSTLCVQRDAIENSQDFIVRLLKGMIEALVFVLSPQYKDDTMQILKKNLRLATAEDLEASYKVLRLMTTLDVSPNWEAWTTMQRIVSRLNPKVGQVDLKQVLNGSFVRGLEETGFLPEMRKKLGG